MSAAASGPRDVPDPTDVLCEELVVFAPFGSAVLEPDVEWVDAS